MEKLPCVYILTNKPLGTLYIGVTSNLPQRIWQHKTKVTKGFTEKYNLNKIVWYEAHADIMSAIQREKALKAWKRDWKIRIIEEMNPLWRDLYVDLF
jgi:putative endonuclease